MTRAAPQQFYVTHCAKADSATGTAGFSVRAASTADPDRLRAAFALPAYELPLDLWAKRPGRADAPRRLARLRPADGTTWVVHTAYLEKDTTNRDRCYFTHAVTGLPHTPAGVLRAWGGDWATDYPPGATKTLPPPARLGDGGRIDDAAVSRFLNGHAGGEPLSLVVAPARLAADPERCERLTAHFLAAVLAATAGDAPDRRRVFVHAEPGVVALLVYAATRLLPAAATADLTFSTYEPPHRNLHEFKLATVVGTLTAHPAKRLDAEQLDDRGYTVDTFAPAPLPRHLKAHAERVAPLVRRAAEGRWAATDAPAAPIVVEPADVSESAASESAVADALRRHDLPAAQLNWEGIASAAPARAGERLLALLRDLSDAVNGLSSEARQWLRGRFAAHPPADTRALKPLLKPVDGPDGEAAVSDPQVPPAWAAYTLSVMTTRPPADDTGAAVRLLATASPAVLAAYLHRAVSERDDGQPLLAALCEADPAPASLVGRLSAAGTVKANWWKVLLAHMLASGPPVAEPRAAGGVLGPLLRAVGSSAEYHPLWQAAADRLDARFVDGDDSQAGEWQAAEAAVVGSGDDLPVGVRDKLSAGVLWRAVCDPAFDPTGRTAELHAACAALGCDPFDVAVRVYRGRHWDADPPAFHPVARLFDALFPLADPFAVGAVGDTLARWCELSEYAPDDARREGVQEYYVRTFLEPVVPPDVLADVLADDARVFLAPRVRDVLTRAAR